MNDRGKRREESLFSKTVQVVVIPGVESNFWKVGCLVV